MIARIPVHVHASDPISEAGLIATLRPRQEVDLVEADRIGPDTVVLEATDSLTEDTLRRLRGLRGENCHQIILVISALDEAGLLTVVEAGVCAVVRRSEATAPRLAELIVRTAAGDGTVPPDMLGRLLQQVGRLQRQVLAPMDMHITGLSSREIEVLRLVAEGLDTREIAEKLSYSERTVKNVLHDVTSRFHLKNRSQAVAYVLREGLI
ncbi:response regulator transcription factor [Streptomyces sp. NPDC047028]|uniref:helix-turn-helix transcriptional regulator n=1 Tax=Streptomyces sp. NPDC047028 TaxID=3155793 RepID=UPI0033C81D7C